jgi:energy-coupling factor transporter ATP-binding protein EcfA2
VKENSSNEVTLQSDEIRKIIFEDVNLIEYITNKDKIREHINECQKAITHKKILEELLNNESFLERLHLRIIKGHFDISNIQVRTTLGDKALKNTSFGERCGIVIAIILVAGTNPIIIDQPEDNLDGKFISNVLVPLIRQQKQNRQIVLVTRDANIAVGSDAELINILEDNSGHNELIPSSIENTVLREKYVWILDGGVEAFQKRERKYNFA